MQGLWYQRAFFRKLHPIWIIVAFLLLACATEQNSVQKKDDGKHNTSISSTEIQPSATANEDDKFILTSIPVSTQLYVQLYVAPCKDGKCPLQIRIKYLDMIVSTVELNNWQPTTRQSQRIIWESYWDRDGDGDPTTFILGEGYSDAAVKVAIQLLKFSDHKRAVLIRQSVGHEHSKAWFTLYEIQEDLDGYQTHKLNKIWEKIEGDGPYASDVITAFMNTGIVNKDNDNEKLIYLEGFLLSTAYKNELDSLKASLLHWSNERKTIVEDPAIALPAIRIGKIYDTKQAARSALEKLNHTYKTPQGYACLSGYWVLESGRFKGLAKGKVVIAFIGTSAEGLKREKARLNSCISNIQIHNTELQPIEE